MMRKAAALSLVVMAASLLTACGGGRSLFNRARPDEMAVTRAAPLVVPPDFALTPPSPGAPRPQEADSSQQALSAMFANTQAPKSQTESDIIGLTRTVPEPGIRSSVAEIGQVTANKGPTTRTILAAAATNSADASVTLGN